jgi:hypothetical protein
MSVNKNVMKMNDEQTMQFIDYYEKEEVLWNTKLQSYRNRDARGEAKKRIVLGMNIEGLLFLFDYVCIYSIHLVQLKKIIISFLRFWTWSRYK